MFAHEEMAAVPGDLPAAEIVRRYRVLRTQFRHDNTIDPLSPVPDEPVEITAVAGSGVGVVAARVYYTTDRSVPGPGSPSIDMQRARITWMPFGEYAAVWTGSIPGQEEGATVRYRIEGRTASGSQLYAQDGQGFWYRYPARTGVTVFAYRVGRSVPPAWMDGAVIYQIFVDRFRRTGGTFLNADDLQAKHGGTLAGIAEVLPYLQDLGVTCLWLSPIGPAPSYHRYDATDLFSVDPILGSPDDLRSLTAQAHARTMRVILDFVPSHLSARHPAFTAARTDPDAATRDWFVFYEWPDSYRSFLDLVPGLVSLNTNSESVRDHLIRSARFWMECGIDGFRLDHVIGHGMDFWVQFQAAMEEANPKVVTIGEATDTGDALRRYRGRVNSILDFPLARALRLTFATEEWSLAEFDGFLDLYEAYMVDGPDRVSFLDNHDMDRFLFVAGQDRSSLKLASLCMLTLRPTPVLYYGTEIGETQVVSSSNRAGGGDALVRQDMEWRAEKWDRDLFTFFREAIRVRLEHLPAVRGRRRRLILDPERQSYAYELSSEDDRDRIAVVLNLSRDHREVPVEAGSAIVLSTELAAEISDDEVRVPARSGVVVRLPDPGATADGRRARAG